MHLESYSGSVEYCGCGAELRAWQDECNACSMMISSGDYIRDPLDDEIRQVAYVVGSSIYFVDGGCMSANEVSRNDIYLESEVA